MTNDVFQSRYLFSRALHERWLTPPFAGYLHTCIHTSESKKTQTVGAIRLPLKTIQGRCFS